VNVLTSLQRRPGLTESDSLLAVTNLSFDISALELFLPLATGARLVVAPKETTVDGSKLLESIRRNAITVMQATPSTWRMLIEAGWSRRDCDLRVWCGGEILPAGLADELTKLSGSVWNLYGPTETTVWSSVSFVDRYRPITIGRPIHNTRFYVLDHRMRRVPIGVPGELYIGGDGLSKGYIGHPELTRERFVPNLFESGGGKLYRTGDEVRYRDDGEIEYLRRLDFQVKVRGHRIELGEVEYCAAQYPGVKQAVAMVRNDRGGDQRLVCYVVLDRSAILSPAELRAALYEKLPSFMVPVIAVLESLPLTENGKIDLARLPEPAEEAIITGEPRNELETRLLDIWKRVLGLDHIGITDNFFDLGGHSLLAMRLLAEIDAVLSQRLPVATVFRAQTVEQMATILNHRVAKPHSSVVTLQPRGFGPPLFVVPAPHGNALPYADFAKLLGFEQPVHLLQYIGLEGDGKPLERVEAIAEYFIGEIRKTRPRGPYRLAGFCAGGIVAFEIAQQLIASGEEPPLLALIETWHPSSVPSIQGAPVPMRPWIFFGRGVARHLRAALQFPPREALRYVFQKSHIIREMILRRDVYRGDHKRYRDLAVETTYRACSRYVPAAYAGRISLFLAGNLEIEANSDTRLCWRDFARDGCVVVRTNARALSDEILKRPHVEAVADQLAQQMRQTATSDVNSGIYGSVS
jgi:thioesterase domain-containing protein